MALKLIFAGTPEFAAEHLQTLIDSEHRVVAVYSQPDRPAGRGRKLTASAVKSLALTHQIPVFQPLNFKSTAAQAELAELQADLMVVVAYGLILPQVVLDTPRLGCVNVHASLLPRWRGAAPIHRALLAGDLKSGITIMQMDAGLDTGAALVTAECDILPTDTSEILHDRLIEIGAPALLQALDQLELGTAQPVKQDSLKATYAHKLLKAEGQIDWTDSAEQIDRQIRGLTPWPGAVTQWQAETVRLHQVVLLDQTSEAQPGTLIAMTKAGFDVATGAGVLRIEKLQLPGKKAMTASDLLNARREQFIAHPRFTNPANL
ncbi:methionyl-tRNA formyltransferase [Reinekea sp.]|jgi:methionyl-tRNA formyltransferase|uniref:methionyl-tRNA formyltransferase n=1 Tax=Reinekea sp. TaxID=1970455 RepID=UPI002A840E24|nr:methionyl-tRNA formyltransferase [Reinekea sp.]